MEHSKPESSSTNTLTESRLDSPVGPRTRVVSAGEKREEWERVGEISSRLSFDNTARTKLTSQWVRGRLVEPLVSETSATLETWSVLVALPRTQRFTSFAQTINKDTFKSLDQPAYYGVHAIGEVWAEMLFEMSENLIDKHGFASDLFPVDSSFYDAKYAPKKVPKAGNALALQLVVDGLKLQPCRPSFVNARDAILTASRLLYLPRVVADVSIRRLRTSLRTATMRV